MTAPSRKTSTPTGGGIPNYKIKITANELAERWSTTAASLAQLRYLGRGPKHLKIPGVGIRYDLDDIEAYERGDEA